MHQKNDLLAKRFKPIKLLGEGNLGQVFLALDLENQKEIALKTIHSPQLKRLLKNEVKLLSQLNHPVLIQIYDYFEEAPGFFTMEYVKGQSLKNLKHNISEKIIVDLLVQVLQGISYLHARKILHHDLKPENLILDENNQIKILDFGLAQSLEDKNSDLAKGTWAYLAPEAYSGEFSYQSDLFSVGVIFYELITGKLPYVKPLSQLQNIEHPKALKSFQNYLPEFLCNLIDQLIELNPSQRPGSALVAIKYINEHIESPYEILQEDILADLLQKPPWFNREKESVEILQTLHSNFSSPLFIQISGPTGVGRSRFLEEIKWKLQLEGMTFLSISAQKSHDFLSSLAKQLGSALFSKSETTLEIIKQVLQFNQISNRIFTFSDLHLWSEQALDDLQLFLRMLFRFSPKTICIFEYSSDQVSEKLKQLLEYIQSSNNSHVLALSDFSLNEISQMISQNFKDSSLTSENTTKITQLSGGRISLALEILREYFQKGEEVYNFTNIGPLKGFEESAKNKIANLSEAALILLSIIVLSPMDISNFEASQIFSNNLELYEKALHELEQKGLLLDSPLFSKSLLLKQAGLKRIYEENIPAPLKIKTHQKWLDFLLNKSTSPTVSINAWLISIHALALKKTELAISWGFKAIEWFYQNRKDLQALELCLQLEPFLKTSQDFSWLYAYEAPIYYRLANYESAEKAYDLWFKYREKKPGDVQSVKHFFYTGLVSFSANQTDKAEQKLRACIKIGNIEEPIHLTYLTRAHSLLASLAQKRQDIPKAKHHLQEALKLAKGDNLLLGEIEQQLGDLSQASLQFEEAKFYFQNAEQYFKNSRSAQAEAIAANCLAMLMRDSSNLFLASQKSQQALDLSRRGGEILQQARYEENLALIKLDQGFISEAKEHFENSQDVLEQYGDENDQLLLTLHHSNFALQLGNFSKYDRLLEKNIDLFNKHSDWKIHLNLLQAESSYIQKKYSQSLECFENCAEQALPQIYYLTSLLGMIRSKFHLGIELGNEKEKALELLHPLSSPPFEAWKIILSLSSPGNIKAFRERECLHLLKTISNIENPFVRIDQYSILALFFQRNRLSNLAQRLWESQKIELQKIYNLLPEEYKMDFEKNRSISSLDESLKEILPQSENLESRNNQSLSSKKSAQISEQRFRQYAEINRQIAQKTNLNEILERVMDAAIEITGAERGFILLKTEEDSKSPFAGYAVHTARHINHRSLNEHEIQFSSTAVKQAIEQGNYLLTDNAQMDTRFQLKGSVSQYNLKAILVVPLELQGEILGAIYLDHRYQQGCFSEEDVILLNAFASQATLAIQKIKMLEDLNKAKLQLEEKVESQAKRIEVLSEKITSMRDELKYGYDEIIGQSPAMMQVFQILDHVTETSIPVWVFGESGTGKELIARSLHFNSPRKEANFVSENVSAIPETLLESELFGHKKGAFTHADRDRVGLFEQANGGTLFLDEIADMSLAMQAKLLRVLQENEIRPVGSSKKVKIDVRLVTASNRDLQNMVQEGSFRQDLFFRINGLTIKLPPLRERKDDIPLLVNYLIQKISKTFNLALSDITNESLQILIQYNWPGNIRELEGVIRNALLFAKGNPITPDKLGTLQSIPLSSTKSIKTSSSTGKVAAEEESAERQIILDALKRHQLSKENVAKELDISLRSLYTRMDKLGIPKKKTVLMKYIN